MTEPSYAVFLSYASQDAQAAQRIAEALRAAGIEVWFDQSELRGGDTWDRSIRQHIHDCRLFVPVISAQTDARPEGYFRREWKLAVDRTHDMSERIAFLVPVVIDGTSDSRADVPERFREAQWTRLPNGETSQAFVERVQRLLSPETSTPIRQPASAQSGAVGVIRAPAHASWSPKRGLLIAVALVVLGALAYFPIEKLWISKPAVSSPTVAPGAAPTANPAPAAFNPPPHSIAVLPFTNVSGDKEQEYFSEGLSEEVLNSLADINGLQVAGRTSSFYFKGKDVDLGTIAHKLNVAEVLEGSVQRSASTIRVTTQLTNAVTGFQVWSKTYDRPLGDVLKLQTDIATAVASALKVTLLGDAAAKVTVGGTHNPAAFDTFLRATRIYNTYQDLKDEQAAIALYTEAIQLDPHYALAIAARAIALANLAGEVGEVGQNARELTSRGKADAQRAIALAPELMEGHLAMALTLANELDFTGASQAYKRALELAPGNARVLRDYAGFASGIGQLDAGIAAARRAVVLDPFNRSSHLYLGSAFSSARRYDEAMAAFQDVLALDPHWGTGLLSLGVTYYLLGNFENARSSCESADYPGSQECLAIVYDKLGRRTDAETTFTKVRSTRGDTEPYAYAEIYAQWGDRRKALEWLDTAMRLRDPALIQLKTDQLLDPLRNEPRFQAIERELKFPQ